MTVRGYILPFLILVFTMACSGGVGGPMGGDGNYAAGPVSLSSPATINREMVVCTNIAGPDVECRGRVAPFAKVNLSVHAPGFSSKTKLLEGLILGTAHAAPLSAIVTANASGAFVGKVGAGKDQVIQIRSAASRLTLTVPAEGESVSGLLGVMKNMNVDSKGNVWFSRLAPPKARPWNFSLASLFFSEARAQTSEDLSPSVETATCDSHPAPVAASADADSTCAIKRMPPGANEPEVVATFSGCSQRDIHFIRSVEGSDIVLAGVKNSVYVINAEKAPGKVLKQVLYPAEVLSADLMAGVLYVTVGGSGSTGGGFSLYRLTLSGPQPYRSSCVDGEKLADKLSVYEGIREVVTTDSVGRQYVSVGRFDEGYRVLTGAVSFGENFRIGPKEIFRSPLRLEAAILHSDFSGAEDGSIRSVFAVLAAAEKKLYVIEDFHSSGGETADRSEVHAFDLSDYIEPYSLEIDPDLKRIAFLDHGPLGARMILLPFDVVSGVRVNLAGYQVMELGNVVPSSVVRISEEVSGILQAAAAETQATATELPESQPSAGDAPALFYRSVYVEPDKTEPAPPAEEPPAPQVQLAEVPPAEMPPPPPPPAAVQETVPWVVNTQGVAVERFDKDLPLYPRNAK